jgi:protein kinase-like protein
VQQADDQATAGFTAPPSLASVSIRYELLDEIGRGGMGVVYKARDRRTGDLVALKAIHPLVAADPHVIERFTNELLLARRITHKNVCRVHDLSDFGGTLVISMELVEGRSLRQMLREVEAVSVRQGVKIARQIAAGLAEAHAQGVIHRDLKPENILISRDGTAKVMDFGIARLTDSRMTVTGQLVGTPAYMSPEQAQGRPADARSDIYSLGLVMYEMFCGRPAFSAETPLALLAKQVSEMPTPPRELEADLPVRIEEAIRKCLAKNPDRRFQSAIDLDTALSLGISAESTAEQAATPELPSHLLCWQRIDWAVLAAAVVGLAIFFTCFERVSLAPRSQVTFDRAVLRRIAEEHLQRLGVTAPIRQTGGGIDPGQYVYVATTYGAAFARESANNPVHYWTWSATFDGGSLNVDNRGRLTSFARQPVPIDSTTLSLDDARRQAARAVEDFFGQTVAMLAIERENGGQVYEFAWLGPADRPPRMRYTVDIDKAGVSSLASEPALPSGYSLESFPFGEVTMNEWGTPVAVVVGAFLCAFGFVNRRRVAPSASWRSALMIAAFVAGAGYSFASTRFLGPGDAVAIPLAIGVLLSIAVYFGSIAIEVLLTKTARYKLDTLTGLFDSPRRLEGSGLSILRGSLIGLTLLGADTLMLWIATTFFAARLSMIHVGLMGGVINGSAWPVGIVVGVCVLQMAAFSLLVAFADAVAERVPMRPWLAMTVAAALLAATGIRVSMAAVQPVPFIVLTLCVDYGLLLVAFRAFDLLTLSAAIGTFALWWANYPLLVMQQPTGAIGPWIAFVVWGLLVSIATAHAFRTGLRHGYRRVAARFE